VRRWQRSRLSLRAVSARLARVSNRLRPRGIKPGSEEINCPVAKTFRAEIAAVPHEFACSAAKLMWMTSSRAAHRLRKTPTRSPHRKPRALENGIYALNCSAGAARVKLQPPIGIAMIGYGNRVGRSTAFTTTSPRRRW